MSRKIDIDALKAGILDHKRADLARAITLVESKNPDHQELAQQLISDLLPHTGKALRIGITGVPGAGKSTTIEALGMNLIEMGHKVCVLAVDPTSSRTGGSILGDKTRMEKLSSSESAFIRPSPSSGTLGGVAQKTRETMMVCEAAGYDIIIVETVGIGQSETMVSNMVDIFMLLMLTGAGDDLQGIKKGVLEIAELIAINKADGDNKKRAMRACADIRGALNMFEPVNKDWIVPTIAISGFYNEGLDQLWEKISEHQKIMQDEGHFAKRRRDQQILWFQELVDGGLHNLIHHDEKMSELYQTLKFNVGDGQITAYQGMQSLLTQFIEN